MSIKVFNTYVPELASLIEETLGVSLEGFDVDLTTFNETGYYYVSFVFPKFHFRLALSETGVSLRELYVYRPHQKKGLATRLVGILINFFEATDYTHFYLIEVYNPIMHTIADKYSMIREDDTIRTLHLTVAVEEEEECLSFTHS